MALLMSMPRREDAMLAKKREKLAASAADVEHVAGALEEREILRDPLMNVLRGAAELVFESDVLVAIERLDRHRSRFCAAGGGHADGGSAVDELGDLSFQVLRRLVQAADRSPDLLVRGRERGDRALLTPIPGHQ